jgi:hypothetical protein
MRNLALTNHVLTNRALQKLLVIWVLSASMLTAALKPSEALFDKTRFVTDLGVAYFCFHHWVYGPYKAGAFTAGAPHRTKALIKAGAALLFAVNRVKAADRIAHNSKSPTLQRIAGSLDKMTGAFSSLGQKFKGGQFAPGDVDALNSSVGDVDAGAKAANLNVKDIPVGLPGGD